MFSNPSRYREICAEAAGPLRTAKSYVSSIARTIKTLQGAPRVCRPSQPISMPKASRRRAGKACGRAVQVQCVLQRIWARLQKSVSRAKDAQKRTPFFARSIAWSRWNLKACCVKARPISYQIIAILDGSAPTPFVPSFCVVESKFCASGRAWKREAPRDVYLRFLRANSRGRKRAAGPTPNAQSLQAARPHPNASSAGCSFPNPIDVGSPVPVLRTVWRRRLLRARNRSKEMVGRSWAWGRGLNCETGRAMSDVGDKAENICSWRVFRSLTQSGPAPHAALALQHSRLGCDCHRDVLLSASRPQALMRIEWTGGIS